MGPLLVPEPGAVEGAPIPGLPASAFGASPGAGEGVGVGAGAAMGAVGAGGGVVTLVSSFLLQAVRPTATRAANRSERFIFFPLGVHHRLDTEYKRLVARHGRALYPAVMKILAVPRAECYLRLRNLESKYARCRGGHRGFPHLAEAVEQLLCAFELVSPARAAHVQMVKAVQIMAGVENDKWVVEMPRRARRLPHFCRMAELLEQRHEPRTYTIEPVGIVHDDIEAIRRICPQELAQ